MAEMLEQISAAVHETWMASKRAAGVTSRKLESGEELMVPYDQLSDFAKELDRGSVRTVLDVLPTLGYSLTARPAEAPGGETAELRRRRFMSIQGRFMGWGIALNPEEDPRPAVMVYGQERSPNSTELLARIHHDGGTANIAQAECDAIDAAIQRVEEIGAEADARHAANALRIQEMRDEMFPLASPTEVKDG